MVHNIGIQVMNMTKQVLITGGAGFIAYHFVGYLLKETDYEIVTFDRQWITV